MINTVMLSVMAFVQNSIVFTVRKLRDERGQDILEYAVLAGAIALVAGGALFFFIDDGVWDTFTEKIGGCLTFDADVCDIDD